MAEVTIKLEKSGHPKTHVTEVDTIHWRNDTGADIISFKLPSCMSDKTVPAIPITHGETTGPYYINKGSNGSYEYVWGSAEDIAEPRNGTIDVGSGT